MRCQSVRGQEMRTLWREMWCKKCGACGPCGGSAANYSKRCVIPRLQKASLCNPCAAKKCSPCAAKCKAKCAGAKCNPCAAKKVNPCAAKCAAKCAVKKALNPCAAKCNPCAAKKANPCGANPCAAKKCGPCGAKGAASKCGACGPCGPCGGAPQIALTTGEAKAAYDCIVTEMKAAYAKSGLNVAVVYPKWKRYSKVAYQSSTHGGRFVQNYANAAGKAYGKYEKSGKMRNGTYLAKDSFTVSKKGQIGVGPLFIMRKMPKGWNKATLDWKYSMVMPNGSYFGETKGANSAKLKFCGDCHNAAAEQDGMFFLPTEFRR
jgi:hypothetical protein